MNIAMYAFVKMVPHVAQIYGAACQIVSRQTVIRNRLTSLGYASNMRCVYQL